MPLGPNYDGLLLIVKTILNGSACQNDVGGLWFVTKGDGFEIHGFYNDQFLKKIIVTCVEVCLCIMVFGGRKKGGDGCLLLCSLDFGGGWVCICF